MTEKAETYRDVVPAKMKPVSAEDQCPARHVGGVQCQRERGHSGRHAAMRMDEVIWGDMVEP